MLRQPPTDLYTARCPCLPRLLEIWTPGRRQPRFGLRSAHHARWIVRECWRVVSTYIEGLAAASEEHVWESVSWNTTNSRLGSS